MATLADAIGKAAAARKTTGPRPGVNAATGEVAESDEPAAPAKAKRSPKGAAQPTAEVDALVASATAAARWSVTKRPENTKRITVDLDPERWKALRLAAVDAGMPAARLLRVCVDRIAGGPGFAAEVTAAAEADGGVR